MTTLCVICGVAPTRSGRAKTCSAACGATLAEINKRKWNKERSKNWREGNLEHRRAYDREYKRKMRAEARSRTP